MIGVDDDAQCEDGGDDGTESGAGRDHEHDDHLQARSLLHGGTTEDRAGHHAWYCDDAENTGGALRLLTLSPCAQRVLRTSSDLYLA